jgi:hypothetical protein
MQMREASMDAVSVLTRYFYAGLLGLLGTSTLGSHRQSHEEFGIADQI